MDKKGISLVYESFIKIVLVALFIIVVVIPMCQSIQSLFVQDVEDNDMVGSVHLIAREAADLKEGESIVVPVINSKVYGIQTLRKCAGESQAGCDKHPKICVVPLNKESNAKYCIDAFEDSQGKGVDLDFVTGFVSGVFTVTLKKQNGVVCMAKDEAGLQQCDSGDGVAAALPLTDRSITGEPSITLAQLDAYLKKNAKGTPLETKAAAFYDLGKKYGIDPAFAVAVAQMESGLGKSTLAKNNYNFFGMTKAGEIGVWAKYATPEEGIEAFYKLIKEKYTACSQDTVYKVATGTSYSCGAGPHAYVGTVQEQSNWVPTVIKIRDSMGVG